MRLNGGSHPKAMADVKGRPLVEHVIDIYEQSKLTNELGTSYKLLLGHLGDEIRLHYLLWPNGRVKLIETGKETQTAGRLLKAREQFNDGHTFAVAYCDCLADVDIDKVLAFHRAHGKLATLVAVPAVSKFGVLEFTDDGPRDPGWVKSFCEKPKTNDWVNFGFFLVEPGVWERMLTMPTNPSLEQDVLPILARDGQLVAYRHGGWFHCVDSPKDLEQLNQTEGAPWLIS